MFKKVLSLIIALLFLIPVLALADGGLIIFPPRISLDESEQNAIVAWNGQEEVFILSVGIRAGAQSSVLKIVPLPANPSKVDQGEFAIFDRLVEIVNQKIEDQRYRAGDGGVLAPPGEGVEITFHEKIGAHDITVAKVNDLDEFIDWVKNYLADHQLTYSQLSTEFQDTVADYLQRNIKFFVFDLIEADQTTKSIQPIVYRFASDYLFYPLEITAFSDAGETDLSEVNLFLITGEAVNQETVYQLHFTAKTGFNYPINLSQSELTTVSPEIASLFISGAQVSQLYYYGGLSSLNRDLVMADLIKASNSPKVYQVIDNRKFWVLSASMFSDRRFNWTDIEVVSPSIMESYPEVELVKASEDPKVYVLTQPGLKRHLPSMAIFNSYEYSWAEIVEVSATEISAYENNVLVQRQGDDKVYRLENGSKRWIKSAQAFDRLGYDWSKITFINQTEFDAYQEGLIIE